MFDIGWMELMVIGVVALIVVGPKDLPDMFRQIGRFTAKLRQMSREFTRAMEQAANDSGVSDVRKEISGLSAPVTGGLQSLKSAADKFEKWDPMKDAVKAAPAKPAPAAAAPAPAKNVGPETAALAAKTAEKRAARRKPAASEAPAPAAEAPAPVRKRGGRTRSAAKDAAKDSA